MTKVFRILVVAAACSWLAACGGGGGSGGAASPGPGPAQANRAPTVTILASGQVNAGTGSGADFTASVGSELSISGGTSTDAEGDTLSFAWTLTSKPAQSTLQLPATSTASISLTPDVQGTYQLNLRVSDSRGAYTDRPIALLVNNTAPVPAVLISAIYSVTPVTRPPQAISIGAVIVLNGSNTTDPDGDPVTTSWQLVERPAGSTAALTIDGPVARFVADIAGRYQILARGQDPIGAYSEAVYVLDATNNAPNAVLVSNVINQPRNSGQATLQASIGYTVVLDSSSSSDAEGGTLTRAWTMSSRPAGSTAALSSSNGTNTQLVPDVRGNYVVVLTVTDSAGATATYTTTVSVNNTRPIASIASNATPIALPTGPTVRVPLNTELTLRGSGSQDADGETITYNWTVVTAPNGSLATLTSPTSETTRFTPDVDGSYVVRLRVTDPNGAYSDRSLIIDIGNYAPVAVVDKNRVTVMAGAPVTASAALSYDEDGDAVTYAWALDARPAGSNAAIAAPNGASLSFTPDVPGTYIASVSVSDGGATGVAQVTIRALAAFASSVNLPFAPLDARYSKGLDKLVIVATNPNSLRIVDPFTGGVQSAVLPAAVKAFTISPNGLRAGVLHEGLLTLVDLTTAQVVHTAATYGSQTEVFLLDDETAYLIGQTGGQWVDTPVLALNARTGQTIAIPPVPNGAARFYGTQRGVFADRKNRMLFMAYGISPADISYFTINPSTHAVVTSGDSPYHGDWPLGSTFFLSGNQDVLFTSAGTYFSTETLSYLGTLGGGLLSMSHSSVADEAVVVVSTGSTGSYPYLPKYAAHYKRYYGSLLLPEADLPLPTIGGQQSYGIQIFHSANDKHVVLVQTGSDTALADGVQYHVINR
ncbi:PKD domain-containing protein [Peristeroidobacter agariperforans]|uniref:PKD domain-containing protein n=1 Tax=Peristeroidobacter agariperforans TaxID=268404 RepID=UPI00101D0FB3|nr:Ig-like domain repeat protein [Peristeroidobacter agariperforans]